MKPSDVEVVFAPKKRVRKHTALIHRLENEDTLVAVCRCGWAYRVKPRMRMSTLERIFLEHV